MFNLSDRDTKLILGMLIICVILLPYLFYSKDTREDTEVQKGRNIQLQERYNQLQAMNEHRDEYIAETKRLDAKRDEIIASFPANILPENTTMLLHNMEQDSLILTDENMDKIAEEGLPEDMDLAMLGLYGDSMIWFDSTSYGINDILPISEEDTEDSIKGIVNQTGLTYKCFYDGMKFILDEFLNNNDPMIYREFSAEYDNETGMLEGSIKLEQYAISGPGRELAQAQTTPDNYGHEIIHGNLPYGVFGPLSDDAMWGRRTMILQQMMLMEEAGNLDLSGLAGDMPAEQGDETGTAQE